MLLLALVAGGLVGRPWLFPDKGKDKGEATKVLDTKVGQSSSSPPSSSPTPTPTRRSMTASVAAVRDGAVRLEVTTCDGAGSGSGFLLTPDLVVTVAHVVEGYRTLAVRGAHGVSSGLVVGMDPDQEVALVRVDPPLTGPWLSFAGSEPIEGTAVTVLGYPSGRPLHVTRGTVSALNQRIDFERQVLDGLVSFDAPSSPGNSGGPVIRRDGKVIGLTEAGANDANDLNYAVAGSRAAPLVSQWRQSPAPVAPKNCESIAGAAVSVPVSDPDASGISLTLARYFGGINEGDEGGEWGGYDAAWAQLTGRQRALYDSFDDFRAKQSTSTIEDVALVGTAFIDNVSDTADVTFTSRQDAAFGHDKQTCSRWRLRYTVRLDSGWWTIERGQSIDKQDNPVPCSSS